MSPATPPDSTPIAATFARLRSQNAMAFMPFITAGDPDLATTQALIRELAARGVDLIEIGFPYSDPIADGPVIQASYTRALQAGLHVSQIFSAIKSVTASAGGLPQRGAEPQGRSATCSSLPPLVAMVAYAIVFRMGAGEFVRQAREAGFAGLIVPDLPADEAQDLAVLARAAGLDLIQLIAPTTTRERTARILETASGFLYCISVTGTTGVRDQLPAELRDQLRWLKSQTKLPLAVGFGISRPDQVDELRGLADGVIVGSAIVRHVAAITDQGMTVDGALAHVGRLSSDMVAATHGTAATP